MKDQLEDQKLKFIISDIPNSITASSQLQEHLISSSQTNRSLQYYILELFTYSLPTIISGICNIIPQLIVLHYFGMKNNIYIVDGIGIANTLFNCTLYGIIASMNTGLISVAAQAYGAKNFKLVGLYFHRTLLINFFILFLCFPFFYFSHDILLLMNTPEKTANYAYNVIIYSIPSTIIFVISNTIKNFLIAQDIFVPQLIVQIVECCIGWLLSYILINRLDLGVLSYVLSIIISSIIGLILICGYVFCKRTKMISFFWFRQESFHNLGDLIKTEIQIGSMIYLEWIAYEILVIFSLQYSPKEMDAQISLYNLICLLIFVPIGISMTLNSFSGNSIGEKNIQKAKMYFIAGILINFLWVLLGTTALVFLREQIAKFYSDDIEIINIIQSIILIYAFILPPDSTQNIMNAYIRGIGREKLASISFLFCYYAVGLPLAFMLGNFYQYTVKGLWIGIAVAVYLIVCCDIWIIWKSDLKYQVEIIEKRLCRQT